SSPTRAARPARRVANGTTNMLRRAHIGIGVRGIAKRGTGSSVGKHPRRIAASGPVDHGTTSTTGAGGGCPLVGSTSCQPAEHQRLRARHTGKLQVSCLPSNYLLPTSIEVTGLWNF